MPITTQKRRVSETDRLTLLAVVTAILFGILQSPVKDVTTSLFELPLLIIAKVTFGTALAVLFVYCISLGMSWYYKNPVSDTKSSTYRGFVYDIGIAVIAMIVLMTFITFLGELLDKLFNTNFLIYIFALISFLLSLKIVFRVINGYFRNTGEIMNKINNWFKKNFTAKRIFIAIKFSAVVGVTYWATTVYEAAFKSEQWWMGILAFILVAAVLLIFGRGLLDTMTKD